MKSKTNFESELSKFSYLRPALLPDHVYNQFSWFMLHKFLPNVLRRYFRDKKRYIRELESQFDVKNAYFNGLLARNCIFETYYAQKSRL